MGREERRKAPPPTPQPPTDISMSLAFSEIQMAKPKNRKNIKKKKGTSDVGEAGEGGGVL